MVELTKENFEDEVLKAEGLIFVDYYGTGCIPCEALMPFVHACAEKYGDKMKFTKLNTANARRVAIGQQVLGLPVMAIYKDGKKIDELIKDDATEPNIECMIKHHIG
ncbi:MAG: thioredoxin [Firmicutes bacterium]|nr:thioredoxin [Bacillota bacterium]